MIKTIRLIKNLISLRTLDLNVIKFLWNECNDLPIVRQDYGINNGVFCSDTTYYRPISINLSEHTSTLELMTTLLHEVGHYKDYKIYGIRMHKKSNHRKEKDAWKWAIRFSEQYNIPIDPKSSLVSLMTYGTTYKCLENLAGVSARQILAEELKQTRNNLQYNWSESKIDVRADSPNLYIDLTIPAPTYKGE